MSNNSVLVRNFDPSIKYLPKYCQLEWKKHKFNQTEVLM